MSSNNQSKTELLLKEMALKNAEIETINKKVKGYNDRAVSIRKETTALFTDHFKSKRYLSEYNWIYGTNEQFMYLMSEQAVEQGSDVVKLMAGVGMKEIPIGEGMAMSVLQDNRLIVILINPLIAVKHIKELGMKVDFTKLSQSYKDYREMYESLLGTQKSDIIVTSSIPDNIKPMPGFKG